MTVDRVGSINPIQPGKKTAKAEYVQANAGADTVAVSTEALEKGELYRAMDIVAMVEDVQPDRIAELKQKINDPSYIDEKLVSDTADRIMTAFGL